MYGYNPLAIDQLAQAHITDARRDGRRGRRVRSTRRTARRGTRSGER